MRRITLPLFVLIAVLAAPAGASAFSTGISDQQASTFTNPLYAPLKLKTARYITPYDVTKDPAQLEKLTAWIGAAKAANQRILISFEHSRRPGRERRLPSVAEFTREMKAFKKRFPEVREISPWNEVTRCSRRAGNSWEGQPTCKSPKRVAQYYMAARKVFTTKRTIVGVDLLDERNINKTIKFLKAFLRHAKPTPKIIGFHNYSDTNRFSTSRTRKVLKTFKGKVWLTETGGIVKLGESFPYDTARAAKALGCMFSLAKSNKRITRLYAYQFNSPVDPAVSFDAGLINPDGTARPGWDVVKARKARACKK